MEKEDEADKQLHATEDDVERSKDEEGVAEEGEVNHLTHFCSAEK